MRRPNQMDGSLLVASYSTIILAVVLVAWLVLSRSSHFLWQRFGDVSQRLFLAGGGIFIFSFAALKSFEYRYIFLLLCLPMLLSMTKRERGAAVAASVTLATMFVLFYDSQLYGLLPAAMRSARSVNWFFTIAGNIGSWVLFVLMLAIIGGLIRSWLSSLSRSGELKVPSVAFLTGDLHHSE